MLDVFELRTDGTVLGLYTDAIDLRRLGHVRAERASVVEWNESAQAWSARVIASGEMLGPFQRRDEAVDAERRHLATRLSTLAPNATARRANLTIDMTTAPAPWDTPLP